MENSRSVCISIVSHGQFDLVLKLLEDLKGQVVSTRIHVILTLNIPEILDLRFIDFPFEFTVLRNTVPKGFGSNHNQAFGYCKSDFFVVCNPDIRIDDDLFFSKFLQRVDSNGVTVPWIVNEFGLTEDFIRSNLTPFSVFLRRFKRTNAHIIDDQFPSHNFFWVGGMFLCFPKRLYELISGFDEKFFMYCEDFDLSMRLFLGGYNIRILRDLSVVHIARRASRRDAGLFFEHLKSLLILWSSKNFFLLQFRILKSRFFGFIR